MLKKLFVPVLIAILCAGCMSFKYDGKSYAPTKDVKFYSDKAKVPEPFDVMGHATCSGDYDKFSKESMVEKILKEAEENGANAVLLYEYAIVPAGSEREKQLLDTSSDRGVWPEGGREVSGWNELEQNFNTQYGTVGKDNQNVSSTRTYRRILKVEFLKYKTKK